MRKLTVEKDEAVADIIERVLESGEEEVLLVVPKRSKLVELPNNFRLLAREGAFLKKKIMIESVDDAVLALARANNLASNHPLFDERGGGAIADILPQEARGGGKTKRGAVKLAVTQEPVEEMDDASPIEKEPALSNPPLKGPGETTEEEKSQSESQLEEERYDTLSSSPFSKEMGKPARRMSRWIWIFVGLVAVLALFMWGIQAAFGKAAIVIRFKTNPWSHTQTVTATTAVKNMDAVRGIIPAQLFQEDKSLSRSFLASGRAVVSEKAKGTLTIVNAYSSEPQELVVITRFETPDGKIYRLDNKVLVPGAKIENGKVIPSSIKTPVTADQPGPSYNVGRVDKLTIPGFKGTPKFEGFYGMLETGAAGGFSGEKQVATDEDAAKAEAEARKMAKEAFNTIFLGGIPSDIKLLDEARSFTVTKVEVNRSTDANGNFSVSATARFQAFGIREEDVVALLNAKAKENNAGVALRDVSLKYADTSSDFERRELRFTIAAEGKIGPAFDAGAFQEKIRGQTEKAARAEVLALPEVASAEARLYPFWMRRVPEDPDRVKIVVE